MIMIDVRRPGREVFQALIKEKVAIGRIMAVDAKTCPRLDRNPRRDGEVPDRLWARHECLDCWADRPRQVARTSRCAPRRRGYGWRGLAGDASGGFIAALVALPYGLALARLMGLPPELGLFTSIITAPVTSILGRNPVMIGGTASATVPFIAAAVRAQGVGGAAKVCLAAAVFMMIFCVLRLGRYVAKVPHAVVSGFSCGVGAMMVILQLRTLLGLPASSADSSASPFVQLVAVMSKLTRHALAASACWG